MGGSREPERQSTMASGLQAAANIAVGASEMKGAARWIWLERSANAALLVASLSVVWILVVGNPFRKGPELQTYKVGEAIEGVVQAGTASTLVMALRGACRYCQESVPFYLRLAEASAAAGLSAPALVVVTTDTEESMSRYLRDRGIGNARVIHAEAGRFNIPATPLLFALDREGIVRKVWAGKLSASEELEVMKELRLAP